MKEHKYYVYMMQSTSRRVLYTGMTNPFVQRVWDHKTEANDGFTANYQAKRLVYYEVYDRVRDAIAREKEIKAWRRSKKDALVHKSNPEWKDLAENWFDPKKVEEALQANRRERALMKNADAAKRNKRSLAPNPGARDDRVK